MDSVMIVAAEASSSLFAERLLQHWKKSGRKIQAFGVGTKTMEELGFERLGKSEEMAVVGAAEIFEHFGHLKAVFDRLVEEAKKRRPKVIIVMDYPEFNLMLSKKMHQAGLNVVYYVSPQVWAWRKGRVLTIKKYCKKVFLLFPFEVDFYKSKNVPHTFVGHPVLDELDESLYDARLQSINRKRFGFKDDDLVLGLMPGSRRGELKSLFTVQLQAAEILTRKYPKLKVLVLVAPTFEKDELKPYMENVSFPVVAVKDDPFKMIALTDFIFVASGTATLMVGLLEKPMVIMYKLKFLTGIFAKIFIRGVKFFGLVNLILGREVCKELFQGAVNPENMATEMEKLVASPENAAQVRSELKKIRSYLGDRGATVRVAQALEEYFQ
jgi:lipid-A-disaccharide synthase